MFIVLAALSALAVTSPAAAPLQEHLVSLGHGAFDSRWNEDTYIGMAAGADYSLMLLPDGSVRVLGYANPASQAAPPGAFTRLATAEGYWTSGGIRADGMIELWGHQTGSIAVVPPLPPGLAYVTIDLDSDSAGAVRSDGQAVLWGENDLGRLDIPPLPPGLAYTKVVVGGFHSLALRSDGVLVSAGTGDYGEHLPPPLPPGMTYTDVDTAYFHTVALRSDGQVIAFGNNDFDQIEVPALPPGLSYTAVQARLFSSAALRSDGALVGWGGGGPGYGTLLPAPGLSFVAFSLGDNQLLALQSDGRHVSFGSTHNARRNVASIESGRTRREIQYASSTTHTLGALLDDGRYEELIDTSPILTAPTGLAFVQLAIGFQSRAALRNDGRIQVSGLNSTVPALPAGLVYTRVEAGERHLLALRSDGALVAWGTNTNGQCNVPALPGGTSYVACAGGGAHSLAVRSDGALIAFGSNSHGQLAVPALPPGTTYVEAWGGRDFSLARRSDGVLVGFGRNDLGQCDVPVLAPGVEYVELACGDAHVAARRSDGYVVLWGISKRAAGEIPPPGGGLVYLDVAARGDETVARLGPPPPTSGPILASVSPAAIESLQPGTNETVTLLGSALDTVTSVLVDGVPLDSARWTAVSAGELTLDMPQVGLGGHSVAVSDGVDTHSHPLLLVAPLGARLELGSGDPANVVDRDDGLRIRIGGPVGREQLFYVSTSSVPSNSIWVSLGLGNGYTNLFFGGSYVMPASGWIELSIPTSALLVPGPGGITFFGQTFIVRPPRPFPVSNLQSFVLVQ